MHNYEHGICFNKYIFTYLVWYISSVIIAIASFRLQYNELKNIAQKMKFSIKCFFSECDYAVK